MREPTTVDTTAKPWALVSLDGHLIARHATEALAKLYRWEQPAGTCVVYHPEPQESDR